MERKRTSNGCTIHDFEFSDRFWFVVLIRYSSRRFPPNDTQFHMFNLDPHQQEVNLSNNDILQMIPTCTPSHTSAQGEDSRREGKGEERTLIYCIRIRCVNNLRFQLPSWLNYWYPVASWMNVPITLSLSLRPPFVLKLSLERNTYDLRRNSKQFSRFVLPLCGG